MFYDRFVELCTRKGVKPGRACTEMGVSRGLAAKWKATGAGKPSAEVLEKMSAYFGLTINEILSGEETEKTPTPEGRREVPKEELMAAFWGGDKDLSREELDAMWKDVERFAAFVAEQKRRERGKNT